MTQVKTPKIALITGVTGQDGAYLADGVLVIARPPFVIARPQAVAIHEPWIAALRSQ